MTKELQNIKVAIVATHGCEELEFTRPIEALKSVGAHIEVISLKNGSIRAWSKGNWGSYYAVDVTIENANPANYDAVVLPGGVMNPDQLRMNAEVIKFITAFLNEGKPVAAICHAPWTLIETGKLKGKKVTSYPSLKTDLVNAGANWVDEEVVVDGHIITSRNPDDLPAFCKALINEIAHNMHVH